MKAPVSTGHLVVLILLANILMLSTHKFEAILTGLIFPQDSQHDWMTDRPNVSRKHQESIWRIVKKIQKLEVIHQNSDSKQHQHHPPASVHQKLGRICSAAIHLPPDPNLHRWPMSVTSSAAKLPADQPPDPRTTAAMMVAPSILRAREINPFRMAKLVAHEIQVALSWWGIQKQGVTGSHRAGRLQEEESGDKKYKLCIRRKDFWEDIRTEVQKSFKDLLILVNPILFQRSDFTNTYPTTCCTNFRSRLATQR